MCQLGVNISKYLLKFLAMFCYEILVHLLRNSEHEQRRIHVMKGDEFAKVNLSDLSVVYSNFKGKDLDFISQVTRENKSKFERAWYEYFGN